MREALGTRKVGVVIALICAVAAFVFAVTVVAGQDYDPAESTSSPESASGHDSVSKGSRILASRVSADGGEPPYVPWISTQKRVQRHEALPCTGSKDPINFEIFSAGSSVAGLPLTDFTRRCGEATFADESPANFVNYFYGDCKIPSGATGCAPPLQIQTWPACQRTLGNYTFEGKPIPHRELPSVGSARVVEILFEFGPRIEVYTGSSTIVLFAESRALAKRALGKLQSQEIGKPPATTADELEGQPSEGLAPPIDGATEGELSC
jgi:hypothetical protein